MSNKPKILVLASWYPNRVTQHLGSFVQRQTEAAAAYADMCVLYVASDNSMKIKYELESDHINNIFTVCVYYKKVKGIFSFLKLWRYFNAHLLGWRYIQKEIGKPDLIHVSILWPSGIFAFYLNCFFGFKYIITEHWSGYLTSDGAYGRMNGFAKYFIRMIANRAKMITPVSNKLKQAMISQGFKTNYELVYNTANVSIFYPPIENKISDKIKFLHVSTLVEKEKNVFGILNTVKQLSLKRKNFFLEIISEKDFSECKTYVKKLEISDEFVSFSGPADASEIADAMRKSHCFVLFSNYENLPVVIIESLACGLPVISTSVGGVPDHITEDFGILIPPKDENALCKAMETMMDNWMKYNSEKMRRYAVDNFSYEAVGEKFNEIYRKII